MIKKTLSFAILLASQNLSANNIITPDDCSLDGYERIKILRDTYDEYVCHIKNEKTINVIYFKEYEKLLDETYIIENDLIGQADTICSEEGKRSFQYKLYDEENNLKKSICLGVWEFEH